MEELVLRPDTAENVLDLAELIVRQKLVPLIGNGPHPSIECPKHTDQRNLGEDIYLVRRNRRQGQSLIVVGFQLSGLKILQLEPVDREWLAWRWL